MKRIVFSAAALALSGVAAAHTGHDAAGFANGLSHPLGGLDHLAAMLAVGLWAGLAAGRRAWVPIAAFMGCMLLGGLLGMAGVTLPYLETGIAASVLVMGLLLTGLARLSPATGFALVGAFALFHGQAHGAEMPAAAAPLLYAAGFIAATGLLHLTGLGLSRAVQRAGAEWLLRVTGVLTGGLGVGLLLGA